MGAPKKNSDTIEKKYKIKGYRHKFNEPYTINEIDFLAKELLKWTKKSSRNIYMLSFFSSLNISRQRIPEFCEKSKYFKLVHDVCKDILEIRNIKMGVNKKNATNFMKFLMTNVYGWRDSQSVEHSGEVFEKIQYVPVKESKK